MAHGQVSKMGGNYISGNNLKKVRFVEKDREETDYDHKFHSLTDLFNPKDMYTREIIQEAVGSDVLTEHIERLDRLIQARGEYVILVKRILDGDYCSCYNNVTKEIHRKYCAECYGTRITGGYQLYQNTDREDGKIIIAAPFTDASVSWEEWGRDWKEENQFWTLPWIPMTNGSTTFSYDFIIRYNEDGTELGRYYVVAVKPSRSLDNRITYQYFAARLADRPTYDGEGNVSRRGDIIYEIDINILTKIYGGKP